LPSTSGDLTIADVHDSIGVDGSEPQDLGRGEDLGRAAPSDSVAVAGPDLSGPKAILALVEAFADERELLRSPVLGAAEAALSRHAARLDAVWGPGPPSAREVRRSGDGEQEPRVLLERPHLRVLWKPPGWTVSVGNEGRRLPFEGPGTGLGYGGEMQRWLAERFGAAEPIVREESTEHGIAHRLDRETSGALLCARDFSGHFAARFAFAAGLVRKEYLCLCENHLPPAPTLFERPLLTLYRHGLKWRSIAAAEGRPACTELRAAGHFRHPDGSFSLAALRLHTGRLHQIRVHLATAGHSLAGDAAYGQGVRAWCPRIFLHASRLGIGLPDEPLVVQGPLPEDLAEALDALVAVDARALAQGVGSRGRQAG